MDDGKELIEMVCTSYESPDDAPEDDQHDFSTHSALGIVLLCQHNYIFRPALNC